MIDLTHSMTRLLTWCAGATIALAASAAVARPVTYLCDEELEVKIDFTPRKAQLHLRDKDYTMQRVKSARDGHYVNGKERLRADRQQGRPAVARGQERTAVQAAGHPLRLCTDAVRCRVSAPASSSAAR